MKRIIFFAAVMSAFLFSACADNLPFSFEQLPDAAKTFVNSNYKGVEVVYVTKDDDLFRPDYNVMLSNGIELEFSHSGSLKKIEAKQGGISISPELIPDAIREFVDKHYPGAGYAEYEAGRKKYEVRLSNRLELKFNSAFKLIEVDD